MDHAVTGPTILPDPPVGSDASHPVGLVIADAHRDAVEHDPAPLRAGALPPIVLQRSARPDDTDTASWTAAVR